MRAFETTAGIARASIRVLRRHPRLLWFPILSVAATIGVLSLLVPFYPDAAGLSGALLWVGTYFAIHLVQVYFVAALTCEALRALRQQPTSLAGGLGCAAARLKTLSGLAAVEATVGLVISALSGRRRGSAIASYLFGTAWSLATYLAMPVLVAERRGAYSSLVRAGRLFRKTWGETALGEVGLRVLTANLIVLVLVLLVVLSRLIDEPLAALLVIALALAGAVALVTLRAIYQAALYIFAAEGVVPDDFDTPDMHRVWNVK